MICKSSGYAPENHLEIPESTQCLSEKFREKVVPLSGSTTPYIIFSSAKLKASYRFNWMSTFFSEEFSIPAGFIFTPISHS